MEKFKEPSLEEVLGYAQAQNVDVFTDTSRSNPSAGVLKETGRKGIKLPKSFEDTQDEGEKSLILLHELGHLRPGRPFYPKEGETYTQSPIDWVKEELEANKWAFGKCGLLDPNSWSEELLGGFVEELVSSHGLTIEEARSVVSRVAKGLGISSSVIHKGLAGVGRE